MIRKQGGWSIHPAVATMQTAQIVDGERTHLHRQVGEAEGAVRQSSIFENVVELLDKLKVQTTAGSALQVVVESCKSDKALLLTELRVVNAAVNGRAVDRRVEVGQEPVLPLEDPVTDQAFVKVVAGDEARRGHSLRQREREEALRINGAQNTVKVVNVLPGGNRAAVAFEMVGHSGRGGKRLRAERALVNQWLMHVGVKMLDIY